MAFDQINPAIPPLRFTRDEQARAKFLTAFRRHVFEDLASVMRRDYFAQAEGGSEGTDVIHERMRSRPSFQFYSALRVASQDLLYHAVRGPVERGSVPTPRRKSAGGSLHLDPALAIPRSVSAVDIHLMPGSYTAEYAADDDTMGAVYDARLRISTFGVFGPDLDDIGQSMARYVRAHWPQVRPARILDLGCTVGHNSLPWKKVYPKAELHGIDVAAPCLRYGHHRAEALGLAAHFWQMDATRLDFPDAHFDLVFSSMFLHEVPRREIARVLAEAHRVLRPGGLMLHMELPPSSAVPAYDSFYLDWDGRYNNEPFYRAFRAMDMRAAVVKAGFKAKDYFAVEVPSVHGDPGHDGPGESHRGSLGRLARGVRWYAFGARK